MQAKPIKMANPARNNAGGTECRLKMQGANKAVFEGTHVGAHRRVPQASGPVEWLVSCAPPYTTTVSKTECNKPRTTHEVSEKIAN